LICIVSFQFFDLVGQDKNYITAELFRGNILPHSSEVKHLITSHPVGFTADFSFSSSGNKLWQKKYNNPDFGFSFLFQDYGNEILGEIYGLSAHYKFYFLNRKLQFNVTQGIGYSTNPYNAENNSKNNAFGSRFLALSIFKISFVEKELYKGLGFVTSIGLNHLSNGKSRMPNKGLNTVMFSVGLNYGFNKISKKTIQVEPLTSFTPEKIKFNFTFMYGKRKTLK